MNTSNSKDVQDLIAEFVSSKNQLLHEEIISSIKRESFAHLQDDYDSEQVSTSEKIIIEEVAENTLATDDLQGKIEILKQQNQQLQQQLEQSQKQETTNITGQKLIGSDDLRMEFLNFTSAHIQQFNHRIKKTEELIEALSQKAQNPQEKRSKRDFPIWLQWANIIALGLIALYFLFQFFSSNELEAVALEKTKAKVQKTERPAIQAPKVNQPQVAAVPIAVTKPAEQVIPSKGATNNVEEPVSTPFHVASTKPAIKQETEPKALPAPQPKVIPVLQPKALPVTQRTAIAVTQPKAIPARQNKINTPAVVNKVAVNKAVPTVVAKPISLPAKNEVKPSIKPIAKVVNTAAPVMAATAIVQKEVKRTSPIAKIAQAPKNIATPTKVQSETKTIASTAKVLQAKQVIAAPPVKQVVEKKLASKEKVYFGED